MTTSPELEAKLDHPDLAVRQAALRGLLELVEQNEIELPAPTPHHNMHSHTFFSYNAYGYSPTRFAWMARQAGLEVAGVVDFDVLDAMEEFYEAGRLLGLKTCASVESRVFVPDFADRVINSPGEPGIAYHMATGFTALPPDGKAKDFLTAMRARADQRNRDLVERVNAYLAPADLDYEADVIPLTPSGNATERHVCVAYAKKAAAHFPDKDALAEFWCGKLECEKDALDLPDGPKLQGLIRAKTMKRGGVGYVQPGDGSFPLMADMDKVSLACNAIPTLTWLNGMSDGEQAIEQLFETAKASGAAALNIIPDRNFTPGVQDDLVKNLDAVVDLAEQHHFPVIVGTEMNSPGNKFVDDFDSEELSKHLPVFLKGAHIVYAHTVLQRQAGLGYLSDWAATHFDNAEAKNEFFKEFGYRFKPGNEESLASVSDAMTPEEVLALVK